MSKGEYIKAKEFYTQILSINNLQKIFMIKLDLNLFLLMNKKKNLIFLIALFILLNNCSFDNKTGIWSGSKEEKERISQLEKEQNQNNYS